MAGHVADLVVNGLSPGVDWSYLVHLVMACHVMPCWISQTTDIIATCASDQLCLPTKA